jgi:hypothetical protein
MTHPHPELHFNNEHLTLDITGLTGGWTFGQLGQLKLFDMAQVQFPHDWNHIQISAATEVINASWHLHANTVIEGTLQAGLRYTQPNGVSGTAEAEAALVQHVMHRPAATIDLRLTVKLDGTLNGDGFSGTPNFGLSLRGTF